MVRSSKSIFWEYRVFFVFMTIGLCNCAGSVSHMKLENSHQGQDAPISHDHLRSHRFTGTWVFNAHNSCKAVIVAQPWDFSFYANGAYISLEFLCKDINASKCKVPNKKVVFSDRGVYWFHTLRRSPGGSFGVNLTNTPKIESEILAVLSGGKFSISASTNTTDIIEFNASGNEAKKWLSCVKK